MGSSCGICSNKDRFALFIDVEGNIPGHGLAPKICQENSENDEFANSYIKNRCMLDKVKDISLEKEKLMSKVKLPQSTKSNCFNDINQLKHNVNVATENISRNTGDSTDAWLCLKESSDSVPDIGTLTHRSSKHPKSIRENTLSSEWKESPCKHFQPLLNTNYQIDRDSNVSISKSEIPTLISEFSHSLGTTIVWEDMPDHAYIGYSAEDDMTSEFQNITGGLEMESVHLHHIQQLSNDNHDTIRSKSVLDWFASECSRENDATMSSFDDDSRSQVANDIESVFCKSGGEIYGIMSWQLCWLRGDDGNSLTDYYEALGITDGLMSQVSKPTDLKYTRTLTPGMQAFKRTLADAFIEAAPSSRRNISLVTIGVDSIWKEVTSVYRGKRVLLRDRYLKELSWLRARKKYLINDYQQSMLSKSTIQAKSMLHINLGVTSPKRIAS